MNAKQISLVTLLFGALCSFAFAQSDTNQAQIQVPPAVRKLGAISQRMGAYLNAMPTFEVQSESSWTLDREDHQVGDANCVLKVRHPDSYHLRVGSEAIGDVWLECASDGTTVTRFYRTDEVVIFSKQAGGLKQILDDGMTYSSVKGSGLDLLIRPAFHDYLMASVSEVQDQGEVQLQGKKAAHFSATWYDGSEVEFWIAGEGEPVLLRWLLRRKLDLGDDQPHTVTVDSKLTWTPNAELPEEFTSISIPAEATEVEDLQQFLLKGGTDQLLGQPAPAAPLQTLSGEAWDLAKHRGQQPVVLFFFASWAAPSTNEMPAVLRFVEEYKDQGVAFYAINVGEDEETTRAFVDKQKFTAPVVLDPKQQAAVAYRITSLPVTVLIGKDGTLQAVHVGTSAEERALIRADLKDVVDGKQLVTDQRDQ